MRQRGLLLRTCIVGSVVLVAGCSTVVQPRWGERGSFSPGWTAIKVAAAKAATDPLTWVPVASAGLISVTGADDNWSEHLADHQPIFGEDAADKSTQLRNLSYATYLVTALATPGDGTAGGWIEAKARGLGVGIAALAADGAVTEGLKSLAGRERPDHSSDRSFPSGHASLATTAATLAVSNLDYLDVPDWSRRTAAVGIYGIAAATGLARVEARKHYLSDSLAGFALGHFIGRFFQAAFLEAGRDVRVSVVAREDGMALALTVPIGVRHR